MASATNAFADPEYFVLQIDTTETFDSALFETTEVLSTTGLIKWNPDIEFVENTVYYWRIIPKEMTTAIWNESSFIYLPNSSPGWNQSHFYQWTKDEFTTFEVDSTTRDFEFVDNLIEFRINNGVFPAHRPKMTAENEERPYLNILGDGEIPAGVYIAVFDQQGKPLPNYASPTGGDHDSELYTFWAQDWPVFPYLTDTPEHRAAAINFLDNVVEDGSYVAVWTIQRSDVGPRGEYKASEWASDGAVNLMSFLETQGAERVRELATNERPYIFVYRKGNYDYEPREYMANTLTDMIEADEKILGKWNEGEVSSTVIGPAFKWNKLLWNVDEIDLMDDLLRLDLYGISPDGTETLLFENIDEFDFDLSGVSATEYPQLRLNLYSNDDDSRTSAQMEYWRVVYDEKPEAALDTDA